MQFIKPDRITLKTHPELTERWVQERIADDPSILGLGDLTLKDKERIQPRAGRLDLLLQDPETDRRYEVEIQLGRTDESHIIRTIEYWDIERKRYPQYEHCAVLVAEEVTSRFLNVIGLFNATIPLIAIQMNAVRIDGKVALIFTRVVDELSRGLVDEDEEVQEPRDRGYWEGRAGKESLSLADRLLELLRQSDPKLELKYNKWYVGLASDGKPDNFVAFIPTKSAMRLEVRVEETPELTAMLDEAGILVSYAKRWGKYRVRLTKAILPKVEPVLTQLFQQAIAERQS